MDVINFRNKDMCNVFYLVKPIYSGSYSRTFLYKTTDLTGYPTLVILKFLYPFDKTPNFHFKNEKYILSNLIYKDISGKEYTHPNLQYYYNDFIIEVNKQPLYDVIYQELLDGLSDKKKKKLKYGQPINGLITGYVDGHNLDIISEKIHSNNIKPNTAFSYAYMNQMLSAVKYLHDRNIVHRDIKPANIIFNYRTNEYTLIDFGLSAHQTYQFHGGTDKYLYPKILKLRAEKKEVPFDLYKATDIYAIGATLFRYTHGYHCIKNGNIINPTYNDKNINIMILKLMTEPEKGINYMINKWNRLIGES